MKIWSGGRASGKTTAAVEWLLGGERAGRPHGWSRAILCIHDDEAERVRKVVLGKTVGLIRYDNFRNVRVPVYSQREWGRIDSRGPMTEVFIDNVDLFLERMLCAKVAGITFTTEETGPIQPQGGDASWV